MTGFDLETAVVGAGPFGLSAASHLSAHGVEATVFGRTMSFWDEHMPTGMLLRSPWQATSIADPRGELTLDRFREETGATFAPPIPLEAFVDYGRWYASTAGVNVDARYVTHLAQRSDGGFGITLEDGDRFVVRHVVLAAGSQAFAWRPATFDGLPAHAVSHASDHRDLKGFAGRELVVIGAGQSAVEYAAIAHEAGAVVRLHLRGPGLRWLTRSNRLHRLGPVTRVLYAREDVGPAGLSRLVAVPGAYRRLPDGLRVACTARAGRPAAAAWLRNRVEGIEIVPACHVVRASMNGDRMELWYGEGRKTTCDHVLLATGYKVNLSNYSFFDPDLLVRIETRDSFPVLNGFFETSVPRLYAIGWASTRTFGPLMRHVAGTAHSSRALAHGIAQARRTAPSRYPVVDRDPERVPT